MIKVAIISGDSSPTGVPSHILSVTRNLDKHKFKVLVIAPPGFLCKKCLEANISCHEVEMGGIFDRNAENKIRKELEKFKPQIIHFHGMRAGWLGRLAARKMDAKKIYSEHQWVKELHLSNPAYEKIQLQALKFLDRWTDKTIAVSKPVYDFLLKLGFNKKKLVVIPNGIGEAFFHSEPIQKPDGLPVIIGTVASLNEVKNHRNAILAMTKIRKLRPELDFKYQIIGEGPNETKLKRLVASKGLDDVVHFLRRVESVPERMRHFTIYLHVSKSETFGLAAGEAMASRLPVIASRIPALEYVMTKETGLFVNPRDPDDIARAIIKLIDNRRLREQMGRAGRKRIADNFSEQKMIQRISDLYSEVIR